MNLKSTLMTVLLFLLCFLTGTTSLLADDQRRVMTPVDLLGLSAVSSPAISPDKSLIVFSKKVTNWKENKQIADLWITDSHGNNSRQLTFDHNSRSSVQFSPDGSFITYLAKVDEDEKVENDGMKGLYFLPLNGGLEFQPGHHAADIKSYQWAPDSKTIYFIADEPQTEEERKRIKSKDDMVAFEQPTQLRRIWSMNVADGEIRKLSNDDRHVLGFALSEDGTMIAYNSARSRTIDSWHYSDIWLMDATGNHQRRLTDNDFAEKKIDISPDNQHVLFISDVSADGEYYHDANLFLVSVKTGDISILAEKQTFEVEEAAWSRNGKSVFIRANMGVRSELWEISSNGTHKKQLTDGLHTLTNWHYSRAADKHVFVLVKPDNPGELYSLNGHGGKLQALTGIHADLKEKYFLPRQKLVTLMSNDGTPLEGLLSYPIDYQPGTRYPLVVNAHGGPKSSDQYGQFRWRTYIPVLAARGFMYFSPNYRGGRGYGDEFMREMVGGIFNNAHLDILSGIDYLIAEGLVDPDRLAMSGWSAGGHMTNKLITFTDRFKAASSGAGAVDWVSMYGESDVRYSRTELFGGTPWQQDAPLDVYRSSSMLQDMWKVKTPTIIFVGEKDKRVPPSQSMMMYRALRDAGVESKLYIAPREPHSFGELRHRLFKINAELQWFEKYVNDKSYEWQAVPKDNPDLQPARIAAARIHRPDR